MPADVYALAPHTGRGGWTWYTASAAWMYRLALESLLGLRLEVDKLPFAPCLPPDWTSFTVHHGYRETVNHINVLQTPDESSAVVDRIDRSDRTIRLVDDHREHSADVRIPRSKR